MWCFRNLGTKLRRNNTSHERARGDAARTISLLLLSFLGMFLDGASEEKQIGLNMDILATASTFQATKKTTRAFFLTGVHLYKPQLRSLRLRDFQILEEEDWVVLGSAQFLSYSFVFPFWFKTSHVDFADFLIDLHGRSDR